MTPEAEASNDKESEHTIQQAPPLVETAPIPVRVLFACGSGVLKASYVAKVSRNIINPETGFCDPLQLEMNLRDSVKIALAQFQMPFDAKLSADLNREFLLEREERRADDDITRLHRICFLRHAHERRSWMVRSMRKTTLHDYLIRQYDEEDPYKELKVVMVFHQIEMADMIQHNRQLLMLSRACASEDAGLQTLRRSIPHASNQEPALTQRDIASDAKTSADNAPAATKKRVATLTEGPMTVIEDDPEDGEADPDEFQEVRSHRPNIRGNTAELPEAMGLRRSKKGRNQALRHDERVAVAFSEGGARGLPTDHLPIDCPPCHDEQRQQMLHRAWNRASWF